MKPYAKEEEDDLQRRRYQVMMIEMIDKHYTPWEYCISSIIVYVLGVIARLEYPSMTYCPRAFILSPLYE